MIPAPHRYRTRAGLALGAAVLLLAAAPAARTPEVTLLDLIETEFGYTTIVDHYQHPVSPQRLLDGARVGLIAYLRSRGIADPQVGAIHARADGRGAVPAIEQQIGIAIERYGARVEPLGLVYAAIRGEVAALHDPYSVFFTAQELKGFSAAIEGTRGAGATATPPPAVSSRLLPDEVGYLALRSFPVDAGPQVRAALIALAQRGARAIVFDLRGNGGGYESAAVHVASAFIAGGPIVANEGRDGKRHVIGADGDAVAPRPLIVLVDHDSASGAELVAGAIQDRGVGRLLGTRTFGKGVAQSMFPLPDGSALKLTTARYYTAAGRFIDGVGLEPDVVVEQGAGAQRGVPGADPQLDRARELLAVTG